MSALLVSQCLSRSSGTERGTSVANRHRRGDAKIIILRGCVIQFLISISFGKVCVLSNGTDNIDNAASTYRLNPGTDSLVV